MTSGTWSESQLCDWMDVTTHQAGSMMTASAPLTTVSGTPMLAEQGQAKQVRKGRSPGGRGTFFSFMHQAERAGRDPVNGHLQSTNFQRLHGLTEDPQPTRVGVDH